MLKVLNEVRRLWNELKRNPKDDPGALGTGEYAKPLPATPLPVFHELSKPDFSRDAGATHKSAKYRKPRGGELMPPNFVDIHQLGNQTKFNHNAPKRFIWS